MAGGLLLGAFGVQGDQPLQDFLVSKVGGPAIGLCRQPIDLLVHLLQDQDEAAGLHVLLSGDQGRARLQLLQNVVEPCECQIRMIGLHALARGIQLLSQRA